MSEVKNITEADFEDAIAANKPVVVDFWATWCGPCRMIGPVLDELAADYGDTVSIVKVNVDEEPGLAQKFGITSIPNIKVFKNSAEIENIVGAAPKASLKASIDKHL
ncbi:MAG: thioredoxin [Fibrobacterales bacterium]